MLDFRQSFFTVTETESLCQVRMQRVVFAETSATEFALLVEPSLTLWFIYTQVTSIRHNNKSIGNKKKPELFIYTLRVPLLFW